VKKNLSMSDYFDTDQTIRFHRSDLLEEYLKVVDPSFTPNRPQSYSYDYCERCKTEKVLYSSEGAIVCKQCGDTDYIMVESDKPSYKDPPPEISYFAYVMQCLWAEKLYAFSIRISKGYFIYIPVFFV
jgi:ribosomal protein S27E